VRRIGAAQCQTLVRLRHDGTYLNPISPTLLRVRLSPTWPAEGLPQDQPPGSLIEEDGRTPSTNIVALGTYASAEEAKQAREKDAVT
jgi:hypothetical protein